MLPAVRVTLAPPLVPERPRLLYAKARPPGQRSRAGGVSARIHERPAGACASARGLLAALLANAEDLEQARGGEALQALLVVRILGALHACGDRFDQLGARAELLFDIGQHGVEVQQLL